MSKITKYQENMNKFIQTKSFINKTSPTTREILTSLLRTSDHIPAILCLSVLNSQCKQYNIRIHGYYIAGCVDTLMALAQICCNKSYFDETYGATALSNLISEVINWTYWSVFQNIETLMMNKNDRYNAKTSQLCIEYCVKYISKIANISDHTSNKRMKKTDIYSCKSLPNEFWKKYKTKKLLEKTVIMQDIENRYGAVCCLAVCLGWIIGQGDETVLNDIENIGNQCGILLKMADDFKYMERDISYGNTSVNHVINYGIKDTYIEFI